MFISYCNSGPWDEICLSECLPCFRRGPDQTTPSLLNILSPLQLQFPDRAAVGQVDLDIAGVRQAGVKDGIVGADF